MRKILFVVGDGKMMEGDHDQQSYVYMYKRQRVQNKYFCPCKLSHCKGKYGKILKKTIQQHLRKCNQQLAMVSDDYLKNYRPATVTQQNSSESESDDCDSDLNIGSESTDDVDLSVGHVGFETDFDMEDDANIDVDLPLKESSTSVECCKHISDSSSENSDSSDDDLDNLECVNVEKDRLETWEPFYNTSLFSTDIAQQQIYLGSKKTTIQVLAEQFSTFTSSNISKSTMSNILSLQKDTLPEPNNMPYNYYEAKKLIQPFMLPVRKYDACPKHCIVYKNSSQEKMYADLNKCPVCEEPRYTAKGRARRQVKYIPVGPRLARLFGNESLAAMLQTELSEDIDDVYDIQESSKYKNVFKNGGILEGQKGALVVGFEADGVAPYHSYNQTYSFTVVTMPVFSLLRSVRMLFRNIFIVMVIPGDEKSETSSQDAYIEILVDELLYLTKSCIVKDYKGAPVELKIKLLLYILDYPGFCKLFHLTGSGATRGCIWCEISGVYCQHLSKMVYLRNRSYLPKSHFRRESSIRQFPVNNENIDSTPKLRKQKDSTSYAQTYERAKNKTQASSVATATGVKGSYPLMKLPSHDRVEESVPDDMHTVQRCLVNIHNLITGKDDTLKLRMQEKEFGRFSEVWPLDTTFNVATEEEEPSESQSRVEAGKRKKKSSSSSAGNKNKSSTLPPAPYVIKNIDLCNKRFASIIFPFGSGLKTAPIFTKTSSINSHDWKELACKRILKFCIRDQLAPQQEKSLFSFWDCIAKLFRDHVSSEYLDALEDELNEALVLMERDFPVCIQNITQHLLHHIVNGMRSFGPLYSTWMFGFERLNGWCSERVLNKRHPESTIIETYLLYDFSQTLAAMGIISDRFLEGKVELEDKGYRKEFKLSKDILGDLFLVYCSLDEKLDALWSFYSSENEKKIISRLNFSEWMPRNRTLSEEEHKLQQPLNSNAYSLQHVSVKNDRTGRITQYSTQNMATEKCDSSVVFMDLGDSRSAEAYFGKIVKIFEHERLGQKHTFCIMEILTVDYDQQTRLWKCVDHLLITGNRRKIVEVKSLGSPVAYAEEDEATFLLC